MKTGSIRVQLLVVALLAIGTIGLAFWLRPGTARYETGGFAFDYPAGWSVHDQMPATTGFGQLLEVLGTLQGVRAESRTSTATTSRS